MKRRRTKPCRAWISPDLWGIACRLAAKLNLLGIMTPLDLKRADPLFLRDRLGVVTLRMAMELRGVACLDLERVAAAARAGCPSYRRFGWEAASPLAGVLESKPALPSREEDTDAAFAATACCNAIPDALACCLSKW